MPRSGHKPLVLGTCDSAAEGYLIASLLKKEREGRIWVFTPHARRRDQLAEELAFWKTPALVLTDPTVIIEDELVDPDREAERISTLHRIANAPGTPVLLSWASWQAPAPVLDSPDETELTLVVGQ